MEYKALHTEATECENEEEMTLEEIGKLERYFSDPNISIHKKSAAARDIIPDVCKRMRKLEAVAKAAKNLDLSHVEIGTYVHGITALWGALEELEQE